MKNLSGRSRRPFLQRRPQTPRKQTPLLPTITTQEVIEEQLVREEEEPSIEDVRFKIPVDKVVDGELDLNLEEQLFANILQQGQSQEESVKSFRGRQQINNSNQDQRTKRPKSIFLSRNRNTSSPRKSTTRTSSAFKSRPTSSAINDIALRNRQRSRSRLRTRPGSVVKSNNRVHPFSTTTKAPTTTTQEQATTTTRFEIPSVPTTFDIEDIFPILEEIEATPNVPLEPREQFPLQPAQDTFVTRARAPVERLLPTTPRSVVPSRDRAPVSRVRQTTTPKPFSKIVVTEPDYSDYYDYYDEEEQGSNVPHPAPVKAIDDYDLFPLNNKVFIIDIEIGLYGVKTFSGFQIKLNISYK